MNMIERRCHQKGFTLIEIVIVMVLLGILAVVAVPKFVDLTTQAKIAATQEGLGTVRSALSVTYAANAANGMAGFPATLVATDFANNSVPINKLSGVAGVTAVDAVPSGTATSNTAGFWFIQATGVAGAYSDGTADTSTW